MKTDKILIDIIDEIMSNTECTYKSKEIETSAFTRQEVNVLIKNLSITVVSTHTDGIARTHSIVMKNIDNREFVNWIEADDSNFEWCLRMVLNDAKQL